MQLALVNWMPAQMKAWLANCSGRRVACKIETLQLAQLPLQNGSSRKKCVMDSAQSTEPRAC